MFDSILAMVNAVATSPSSSIRSKDPVGKNGNTSVKDATNSLGSAKITESCSKMTAGELKDARKATCCPRILCALFMKRFGKPSSKLLEHAQIFVSFVPKRINANYLTNISIVCRSISKQGR